MTLLPVESMVLQYNAINSDATAKLQGTINIMVRTWFLYD